LSHANTGLLNHSTIDYIILDYRGTRSIVDGDFDISSVLMLDPGIVKSRGFHSQLSGRDIAFTRAPDQGTSNRWRAKHNFSMGDGGQLLTEFLISDDPVAEALSPVLCFPWVTLGQLLSNLLIVLPICQAVQEDGLSAHNSLRLMVYRFRQEGHVPDHTISKSPKSRSS
jgi:hypothetical protein